MPDFDSSPIAMTSNRDPNAPRSELTEPEQVVPRDVQQQQELIKQILEMYDQAKQARATRDQDWQKRVEFYQDNQWDRLKATYKAKPVLNIIRTTIQSIIPILTDNRPGLNVVPPEPTDFPLANILNDLVSSWWERMSIDHTLIETLVDTMVYDAAIWKITWDPDEADGMGDVKISTPCPEDIYVPSAARDFGKDCPYVIERSVKTLGYLRRKFPEKAKDIKPDSQLTSAGNDKSVDKSNVTLVSPTDKKWFNQPQDYSGQPGDTRKTCEVWECWMDSDEIEDIILEKKDENGNIMKDEAGNPMTVQATKMKFPNGRVVTILPNQKILLQDIPNPYKHGKFPFIRFVDYIFPRSFWGEGETKNLMPLQRIINKLLGNMIDYSNLMANPVWITENGNGVDPDRLTNQTGAVIQTEAGKGGTIKRDVPSAAQPGGMELLSFVMRQAEMVSGVNDVTQGRKPQGITAAQAIESLQEASQTRIRLKERNMNVSLAQAGRLIVALMMQYYTTPRVVALDPQAGSVWPQYFEFYTEHNPDGTMKWNKKEYIETHTGPKPAGEYQSGTTSKTIFDVKILSGTSLPFAKTQRSNIAFKLFEDKVIDGKELLDTLEWPNAEEILTRMQQEAQAQAAAAQPQQANPAASSPQPGQPQ